MAKLLVFIGLLAFASAIKDDADDCPFTDGTCPVTLNNVVDVFFHDIDDHRSCQRECQIVEDCKFFTMFGEPDTPKDHKKCFLFKTCDHLEPCEDCTTGPDFPLIDDENCTNTDQNYTCETDLKNIVDVYYFDDDDSFSCPDQCNLLESCNFWTFWDITEHPNPHHKCFLYKNCDIHEPCASCETGSKTKEVHQQPQIRTLPARFT